MNVYYFEKNVTSSKKYFLKEKSVILLVDGFHKTSIKIKVNAPADYSAVIFLSISKGVVVNV